MTYNPFTDNSLSQDTKAALMRSRGASGSPLAWDRQQAQDELLARQPLFGQYYWPAYKDTMSAKAQNMRDTGMGALLTGGGAYNTGIGNVLAGQGAIYSGLGNQAAGEGQRALGQGQGNYYNALGSTRVPAEAGVLGAQANLIKNFNFNDMLSNIGEWFKNMPQFNFGGGWQQPAAVAGGIAANQAQQLNPGRRPWELV